MPDVPNQANTPDQPAQTPPPRKKKRLWLKVLGVLLVLLIALVLLIPTIASTGPVRSFVVDKVNEQINGKVTIDSWSLGWFSPIGVSGLKVYDQEQRLILDVPRVKLGLSISDAIRQNFALGNDNVIDVDSFLINVDESGKSNLERLPKAKKRPGPPAPAGGATKLPNISGTITVNFRGTVEGTGVKAPIHVDPSTAVVKISSINEPVQNTLKLVYRVGEGAVSTIETSGSVDAIKNNVLDLANFNGGQKINLQNVNLAAAGPFIELFPKIEGVMTGGIEVTAQGITGLSANGQIVIDGLALSGGPLGNDTFKQQRITIPVQITRTAISGGDSLIKFENVGLKMNDATVAVTGQVTEKSLLNLVNGKPPGADGSITLTAAVTDLKSLAMQLKDTLKLQQGVEITGGSASEKLTIALTPEKVAVNQDMNLQATGTRNGQRIELKPISVVASASAIPNGKAIPDVRDLKLAVQSAFATVTGGGESIAKLAINGKVMLDALATEVGQFVDMSGVQLQGTGDFALATDGDLASDNAPIKLTANANFQNVKVIGVANQRIDQDRLSIQGGGTLVRADKAPVRIEPAFVYVIGGDPAAPLLDVDANAIVDLKAGSVPWFELKKCTITSLPKLQEQYGGLVPVLAEQKIKIESGALYASAAGAFDGTTVKLSKPAGVSIPTLTIRQGDNTILKGEIVRASLLGSVALKDGVAGEFSDLSVTTESKLFTLAKGGQGPLTFTMTKHGNDSVIRGNGVVTLAADLKRLADLAQAFGGNVTISPDQPQIRSGALNGTITLAKAAQPQTDLKFDGQITGLTIVNAAGPIAQNEQLTINLTAAAPDDLNSNPVTASAKIAGSFVNATVSDAKIAPNGAPLEMLRSANVDAQVTDLAKAYALVSAAGGGAPAPTTGPALAPLQVTGGSASLKMNVTRDLAAKSTNITVSDARITRLALKRGDRVFPFDANSPITAKLNATLKGTEKPESIEIKELNADARIASLSMPEPITITGLQSDRPVYQGSIAAKGKIEDATPLLAVLQGADPMPYAGTYDLSQKLSTSSTDGAITLAGAVNVNDFRVMSGNRPAFSEPRVAVRDNIAIILNGKKLQANELTVTMPQSQALALSLTGGVNAWDTARTIRPNTKLDVTYDLEKVWTIVRPMLSPEQQASYKDLKIAGKYQKSFTLTGAFPAGPIDKSFASLNADGGLAIDLLDTMGLNIQKFQPVVKMTRGKVVITGAPAILNEGTLDASEIVIDMAKPSPELTVARNKRLVRDAKINPVLANSLGKFASVIFSDTRQASGLLDVTVIECQQVPITALMTQSNQARAKIVYSIRDIQVDGVVPKVMSEFLALGTPGLVGEVPQSTVTLENGRVASDMTFAIRRAGRDRTGQDVVSDLPLKFVGSVGLKDLALHDFEALIPKALIPDRVFGANIGDVRRLLPAQIKVPITGTLDKIKIDPAKAVLANVNPLQGGGDGNQDPLKNLGNILNQLGNQPPDNRGQPRPQDRGRGQ